MKSRHLSQADWDAGWRLSCISKVKGNVTVDLETGKILATGAIFSAIDTLLKSVDMPVEAIDRVYVAGGIGSGINMKNAVNIGMFPDVELDKFQYIGNSSLTGAYAMVLSDEANTKRTEVAANMTYLELSTYPGYMDSFAATCFIPHADFRLFPNSIQKG